MAIIFFRIFFEACILLGDKIFVAGHKTIPVHVAFGGATKVDQLSDNLILAGSRQVKTGSVSIALRVLAEILKTRVAVSRPACSRRIGLIQIVQNSLHRCVKAVKVDAVETDS